ncbi:NACHT domain-containing protein [Laspinema sp. A4]|uniref:NACHT domain-containing protein n=1 Tax=Laspinema sp. D2d TaxID=2953686 RepID=UPI0021BABB42|nr:NACHT domain-containing protein [Laspinema sp. D2d]MCT7984066.1 NACHT domain-containing protein [Laspinema sp. D2d]
MSDPSESNVAKNINIEEDLRIKSEVIQHSQIGQAGGNLSQVQYVTVYESTLKWSRLFHQESRPSSPQDYRFRKILLNKIKQDWVKGVLEKSLHSKAMIELGLQERVDAVDRPVNQLLEMPEECDRLLPSGTSASDIFTEMGEGRTLLILGEPGSGKTTILLKITRDLINETEADLTKPIPVIFNLSSWVTKRQSIAEWLIQELNSNYQVSKSLGKCWINEQQLLLMLDGLDEVKGEHREACVQGLNQFIEQYGQTEIVVCSRIRDYEALSARLKLRCSICVQSLTPEQIHQYLNAAGDQLEAVKMLLKEDSTLQELARSPLMLSIITVAYQNLSGEDLTHHSLIEERRQHLLNTYIERMFRRKLIKEEYAKYRATRWLIWLSKKMVQESQSIFLIEKMQPTWLESTLERILYRLGSFIIAFTVSTLGSILVSISLALMFLPILLSADSSYPLKSVVEILKLAWYKALSEGSIIGLSYGVVILSKQDKIQPIDSLNWSWEEALKSRKTALIIGLISGIGLGILKGLYHEVQRQFGVQGIPPGSGVVIGIFVAIMSGVSTALIYGFTQGFKGEKIQPKNFPNQNIWESAKNACILGLAGGLMPGIFSIVIAVFFLLLTRDTSNMLPNLIGALTGGFVFGTPLGLIFGGIGVCIKHFTLRLIIYSAQYIPWNYARFLDYAAERIFLQRVGGGYIFIHRILLEHFAKMEIKP